MAPGPLVQIYQCFCDQTRLRILNLLLHGPLCVCHLQELLQQPQVKVSKHLAYLKSRGVVDAIRHQNWMVYSLPAPATPELDLNLKCLQQCVRQDPAFVRDLRRLAQLQPKLAMLKDAPCCATTKPARASRRRTASPS